MATKLTCSCSLPDIGVRHTRFASVSETYVACYIPARIWLYKDLATHPAVQYAAWVSLPVFLILFSAGFVHIVAPQSIGNLTALTLVAPVHIIESVLGHACSLSLYGSLCLCIC
jgi:hypothetical protein